MPCPASPEGLGREVLRPREAGRVQCSRQVFSMPADPSPLLCAVCTFKARWLKRGVPRYPHAISGALRALQRGKFVLVGLRTGKSAGFGHFDLIRRVSRLGALCQSARSE